MERSQEEVDALKGAGDKGNAEKMETEEGFEEMEVADAGEQPGTSSGTAGGSMCCDDDVNAEAEAALAKLAEATPDPAAFRKRVLRLLRDTERRLAEPEVPTPEPVRRRVRHLRYLQLGLSYLRTSFDKEVFQLQRRYLQQMQPLLDRRRLIAQGLLEPTAEECGEDAAADDEASIVKGVPGFWLCALRNSLTVGQLITARDGEVLKYLADIRVVMRDGAHPGFKLEFHFQPNDHLADSLLTKEFDVSFEPDPKDPLCGGGMRVLSMRGSGVHWKTPQHDVTRLSRSGATCDSFFHFFARDSPAGATKDDDELDAWERDVDVGLHLQSSLVPRAVLFYMGEAAQTEYSDTESYYSSYYSSSSSSRSRGRRRM